MSDEGHVLRGIESVAAEHLDFHESISLDAKLVEDLELDSIKLLTLAVEVENLFRIRLEPDDEEGIVTVGDLVRVVQEKLRAVGE